MRTNRAGQLLWVLSFLGAMSPSVSPAESAVELPVSEGLELWLDAAQEPSARTAAAQAADGVPLDVWHDRSERQHHVRQSDVARQPRLLSVGDAGWVVRFDGHDDHLRILDLDRRWKDVTLFVVAAPHSDAGGFRGLLSFNQRERRDYETGFTMDLNSAPSPLLRDVNLEGRGFGGARDLLNATALFGTLHVFEARMDSLRRQVRFVFDGDEQGSREFAATELVADELTIGARHYENGPGPQHVQGFLHGDIAEVLLFDRLLTDQETDAVRNYLQNKHEPLKNAMQRQAELAARAEDVELLVPVADAPPVQMLVPGFVVHELPIELTNINNLRYRHDGKLYALGYNGDIWLLSDSNGDQLEDTAHRFFENQGRLRGPIGMQVIPAGHPLLKDARRGGRSAAQGVVVASKGKVSAILDRDGDDVAETEQVIASGWQEIPQNVDAVGVAIHPDDGAIYFGLGTAAYNNAYLLDDQGNSAFDLHSQRGTVQRIEADLSNRTTVCTGVRFTIGMEFDAAGQLFVSDQEGATWLPNGNPFDELLHIRPGLHFGFPPRHPRHLPQVFDEPSLFDYGPQHQSTCGMAFNLPRSEDAPIFGPPHWRGNLLVTGESRGKLYRTELATTSTGQYVARNHLIGCLSMLTVDCCLSPHGDLVVACHSGGPDWGTGPSGIGKLFRIRYQDAETPQPLAAWASGPQEVQIAFDRPLQSQQLTNLVEQVRISYGQFVAAADRFETIRPGYAVTEMQVLAPRYKLPVYSASVTPDGRRLILSTAPHPAAVQYAITLPGLGRESVTPLDGEIPQHPQIDLAYSLNGVWAEWHPQSPNGSADADVSVWKGWLPHLDLRIARQWTAADERHELFWQAIQQPGTLTVATQIDSRGLFAPAVQPGSVLDYEPHDDRWIRQRAIEIRADRPFTVKAGQTLERRSTPANGPSHLVSIPVDGPEEDPMMLIMSIETNDRPPTIELSWLVSLDDSQTRSGTVALHRMILPWARLDPSDITAPSKRAIAELADASWGRGRRVFYSEQAGCAKCHAAQTADAARIGPDLSNLIHRDYTSVVRDITQPNFAINPDYITFVAELTDGRVLTGAVRSQGDQLLIGDKDGKVTTVARSDVDSLTPSPLSIMPDDIGKKLDDATRNDLLAFLLNPPPRMPPDGPLPAPPPRQRSEVEAVLAGADPTAADQAGNQSPLRVLLVAGPKDHGPGEHDYPAWLKVWSQLLEAAEGVTVSTAMEWPTQAQIQQADTIVFFQKGSWNAERAQAIDAHLAKGGGLVYIHWAVEGGAQAPEFAKRIGLASEAAKLSYRHGPLELGFETGASHPIGRNFDRVHFYDESYWRMQGDPSQIRVLAAGIEEGQPWPLFWTFEPAGGRVFVSILGHYSWTFDDPLFRILLLRGIAWSARQPVDRLNEVVWFGVQVE